MYKAIKNIGGYSIGDVVPDTQAETWLDMYTEPHVEKVREQSSSKSAPEETSQKSQLDNVMEDYLGRNQNVVRKNVLEDGLSKNQLKSLLKLEESDKRRPLVVNAIKTKLNS